MSIELTEPEDAKLLALARACRARTRAREGAAVRDTDGRAYSATNVDLPTLQLSAVEVAVAMAVSGGIKGLEAGVVVTDGLALDDRDVTVVRELAGADITLYRAASDGTVLDSRTT